MGRLGKRERARVKKPRRLRMWTAAGGVDGADLATGAIGREHLRRYSGWNIRRQMREYAAFRLARHQGGNRKHDVHSESAGIGEDGRPTSTRP